MKALKFFSASLKADEKNRSKAGTASNYNSIGRIYIFQRDFVKAMDMFSISLKLYQKIGDKQGITACFINMAEIFIKESKLKAADEMLKKALILAKETRNHENLRDIFLNASIADSALNNYKEAYVDYKQYTLYRDSISNAENIKKTLESSMQYEFDKKELAGKAEQEKLDVISNEEKQKQKLIIYAVAGVLLIVFVFSVFLFRRFKITEKQKHIISLQKDEVLRQKHIVEEHQKEMIDSITYAKRLQQAILPSDLEIKKYVPDNFIYYKPKDIVAGDFYWMQHLDNITFIAAADSTGHGVPGAMVSVVCSNALNRAVKEFGLRDTGKILDKTRELVLETFEKSGEEIKDGMDISLLAIDKAKQQVYWSGANNQLWYIANNELKEIKADKQPIGQTDNPKPFTTHTIELKENTTFYLMTDGYPDQFGGDKGKKYKYKQLEELLIVNSNKSLQEQKNILSSSFNDWKGNLEQVDDVTIIGIRI